MRPLSVGGGGATRAGTTRVSITRAGSTRASMMRASATRASTAARASANSAAPPAVILMARAPRRGEVRHALEPLIGLDACVALQTALIIEAMRWARSLQPRELYIAHEPADAGRDLQRLVGDDVVLFPQNGDGIAGRVADAVARISAHSPGPIFIVWPDLPQLGQIHAEAARIDLADGADLVLGPVFDGGYYLIALSRPLPSLFALPEQVWRGPDSFNQVLLAATRAGLEVGVLRWERALHRPADARAALADPLLPEAVGRALGRK